MHYRNPIKIMCTTRLNDGIFTVHRFSVATSTRLRKSECVFRFFVYGGIFDNPPGFFTCTWNRLFLFFVFCFHVNTGALIPRRSTATVRGGGFLLSRVVFLVMLVVYVFASG
jgi:hypothetical protein